MSRLNRSASDLRVPRKRKNYYLAVLHSLFQTGLYRLFLFFMMIWGFAGTVATGVTGACPDLEDCAYQENQGVNKAMAICILVLHILTFIYCIFTMEDADKFAVIFVLLCFCFFLLQLFCPSGSVCHFLHISRGILTKVSISLRLCLL